MRINNNVMALNAHRQLGTNQANASKSMEKLSSGFRINRAGDDAAGLAISEKMRGQIRGLTQASRNAQDGISLIQTAEGALNETHSILQRMRELAAQSATDTNTNDDRKEIQEEINQLAAEISRIADTTEFNTMNLLGGQFAAKFHIGANSGQSVSLDIGAMDAVGLEVGEGADEAVAATAAFQGLEFTAKTEGQDGNSITVQLVKAEAVESAVATKAEGEIGGIKFTAVDSGVGGNYNVEFVAANPDTAATTVAYDSGTNTITVTLATNSDGDIIADLDAIVTAVNDAASAVKDLVVAELADAGNGDETAQEVTGALEGGKDAVAAKAAEFGVEVEDGAITINVLDDTTLDDVVEGIAANNDAAALVTVALAENADGETVVETQDEAVALKGGLDKGFNGINVSSQDAADEAITTINDAIKIVSAERSKLGAMQNRLEHTIANLGTSAENLQAAESRIRDLDMAEEIMAFTKNNILQQAATAMLAQANMAPQSVLQLLG